jgi:hypothetical protein
MENQNSHKDNLIKELSLSKPSLEVFDYFTIKQDFNIPESSQESHKKLVRALELKVTVSMPLQNQSVILILTLPMGTLLSQRIGLLRTMINFMIPLTPQLLVV